MKEMMHGAGVVASTLHHPYQQYMCKPAISQESKESLPLQCDLRDVIQNHVQGAIEFITGIKMKSDRNHPLQDLCGWLNMKNARFRGPRPESLDILPRAHCDRDILMPRNLPIRLWDFVEEDATEGESPFSEHFLSQLTHRC